MSVASDFRAMAREALRGKWKNAILVGLLASLLGVSTYDGSINVDFKKEYTQGLSAFFEGELWHDFMVFFILAFFIGGVYAIARLIICGPVTLGYARYHLNLVDHEEAKIEDLFSQFHRLKDGICLVLLRWLYTFLWTLLLVIPGIIATYRYSMAFYIMAEHPGMTAGEAITASKEMMKGNKFRLFCLFFSFIGWEILIALGVMVLSSLFLFGRTGVLSMILAVLLGWLGSLALRPYIETAAAAFYREVSGTRTPPDAAGPEVPPYEII